MGIDFDIHMVWYLSFNPFPNIIALQSNLLNNSSPMTITFLNPQFIESLNADSRYKNFQQWKKGGAANQKQKMKQVFFI